MDDTTLNSESDNSNFRRSGDELESSSTDLDQLPEDNLGDNQTGSSPERHVRRKGITGGYYWFPTPAAGGITWSVVTCRDLKCGPDAGHDQNLWPKLIGRLAAAWGKDAKTLERLLGLSYTGLPRGRVTQPGKAFLILHGNDSPDPEWVDLVTESFRLTGRCVKLLFDEHETMIVGHPQTVESSLGFWLYGPGR